jgi:hypothetical protein
MPKRHKGLVDEADVVGRHQPQPQLDVERLPDALVEAARPLDSRPSNHHRGGLSDPIRELRFPEGRQILPQQRRSVVHRGQPSEAGMQDLVLALPRLRGGIVWVVEQDLAAGEHEPDSLVAFEDDRHLLETVGAKTVVMVEKLEELALR